MVAPRGISLAPVRIAPHFQSFGTVLVSLILGTTVIHEFIGPLLAKFALSRAGEIRKYLFCQPQIETSHFYQSRNITFYGEGKAAGKHR